MLWHISKKRCNQPGFCLLVVLKDGKEDRCGNAYIQQQMPEDFADYLISLQAKVEGGTESNESDSRLPAQE